MATRKSKCKLGHLLTPDNIDSCNRCLICRRHRHAKANTTYRAKVKAAGARIVCGYPIYPAGIGRSGVAYVTDEQMDEAALKWLESMGL